MRESPILFGRAGRTGPAPLVVPFRAVPFCFAPFHFVPFRSALLRYVANFNVVHYVEFLWIYAYSGCSTLLYLLTSPPSLSHPSCFPPIVLSPSPLRSQPYART